MSASRLPLAAACLATVLLGGCMTKPLLPTRADGTYCYRDGNELRGKRTCTPRPVPPAATEAEARRGEAAADALTVFVLRQSSGDRATVVTLEDGQGRRAETVPRSFVRLQLVPGTHQLTARWQDQQARLQLRGGAGEVLCVELIGSTWVWGSSYRMELAPLQESRADVANLRLVADLQAAAAPMALSRE